MNRSIRYFNSLFLLLGALALANVAHAKGNGTAGVWEVHITPEGAPGPVAVNLVHFDQDGTLTNIDPHFGTGLGTWERASGGGYASEITHYFLAEGGAPGMVVVHGWGEFGEDKDTAFGEFTTTIYVGGAQVDQFSGTIESYRK